MGRYVEIKKIKEESNVYYYSVFSPDYKEIPLFYIEVDSQRRMVGFYKALLNKEPDFKVFIDENSETKPDWIPGFLIYATLKKVRQAIESNQFQDYISFQS